MFEVEGQFKGQEMPSFAGIVMTDNMNFTCQNGVVSDLRPYNRFDHICWDSSCVSF